MTTKDRESRTSNEQDTPGRPNSSASRQQTHKDQGTQTGSPAVDANSNATAKPKRNEDLTSLPTRPATR